MEIRGGGREREELFSWYHNKNSHFITKRIIRIIGHLFGIWTVDEYLEIGRKIVNAGGLRKYYLQVRQRKIGNLRCLNIENFANIGENLILPHGINIVVNNEAKIGKDCTIYQGVTIGIVSTGKRAGVPVIEDRVTVGPNAVVVGGITVGHDSFIVANSFVDFDVPPCSLIIGNPASVHKVKHKERENNCDNIKKA